MVAKTKADVLEQLGNPREVDRQLQDFRRAARVFSSSHPRLIDEYPNQWVAVYRDKVKAHGSTLNSVVRQVDKLGLPKESVVVRFIDRSQRTLIL